MKYFLCLLLVFSISWSANAQNMNRLSTAIQSLSKDPDLQSANWSVCVRDMNNGSILTEYQSRKSLSTASTMKAFTTATALSVLGSDFRFKTVLEIDGNLTSDGVLQGNLYIRGEGDPTLGSDRFGEKFELVSLMHVWANLIKTAGIKRIDGHVIGDATSFSSQLTPGKWSWEDMGNYYGAGAAGLNIHENYYRLDFQSGPKTGDATKVMRTEPNMTNIVFINEVSSRGSSDNAYIFGSPYTNIRYLRGTIPPGRSRFSIKGSIPDPALFCAERLTDELSICGVPVSKAPSTMRLEDLAGRRHTAQRKVIHTHQSPALRDIAYHTNMKSINLYAEALAIRTAIALKKGNSTAKAVKAMEDYWATKGVSTKGMYLRDGSGLSPNNVLSTSQLTAVLYRMRGNTAFYNSLPLAGKSGSLKSMLKGTVAEGRLRAKSGYISGVRSYAGYVETVDGKKLAFAMIANHFSCGAGAMRRKLEKLMVALAAGS